MLPLLALGLLGLGAGAYGQQWFNDRRQAQLADQMSPLLGPPAVPGRCGRDPGTGLLADPACRMRQMEFARGMLTLPGGARALSAFEPMLGRAVQSKQWGESQQRQSEQYQQTKARLSDQFSQQFGLSKQQADEMAAQHVTQQQQWERQFAAMEEQRKRQAQADAARLGIDYARLGLERQRVTQAGENGGILEQLPKGYMLTDSASGPVAAPIPGTAPYKDAVQGERSLVSAGQNIQQFLDLFAGKEQTVLGKVVRRGGTGTELTGEKSSQLSTMRSQIVADIAVLRNLGVLQAGEMKNIEDVLPDPTAVTSSWRANKSTQAAYETLLGQFQGKLKDYREANPWLLPPPPKGAVVQR